MTNKVPTPLTMLPLVPSARVLVPQPITPLLSPTTQGAAAIRTSPKNER